MKKKHNKMSIKFYDLGCLNPSKSWYYITYIIALDLSSCDPFRSSRLSFLIFSKILSLTSFKNSKTVKDHEILTKSSQNNHIHAFYSWENNAQTWGPHVV